MFQTLLVSIEPPFKGVDEAKTTNRKAEGISTGSELHQFDAGKFPIFCEKTCKVCVAVNDYVQLIEFSLFWADSNILIIEGQTGPVELRWRQFLFKLCMPTWAQRRDCTTPCIYNETPRPERLSTSVLRMPVLLTTQLWVNPPLLFNVIHIWFCFLFSLILCFYFLLFSSLFWLYTVNSYFVLVYIQAATFSHN